MAQPRPSLTLVLDIDERLDSKNLRLEVDRCYSYVGTTLVRTHAAGTQPATTLAAANAAAKGQASAPPAEDATVPAPVNVVRLLVRMGTRKYLRSSDEGSDALWSEVMERWFFNEFYKVGNNLQIFNRRQREEGNPELSFDWLAVELENGEVCVWLHLDSESGIDPKQSAQLTRFREKLNSGTFAGRVERVIMPDPADYEHQRTAGLAAKAERAAAEEAARTAAQEEARRAQEEARRAADEAFLELPDAEAAEKEEREREEEKLAAKFALKEPDFPLDYHLWRIEYADGDVRVFDSTSGAYSA